jgi:hypothetical protein
MRFRSRTRASQSPAPLKEQFVAFVTIDHRQRSDFKADRVYEEIGCKD